jgi:type IV pilus assembly protein PilQ
VLFTGSTLAAMPSAATLEDVDVVTLSGGQVRLGFRFEGGPPGHESFTISDPARIVVDFADTTNAVSQRFRRVGAGLLESVTVSEAGNRTRATVKLSRMVPYDIQQEGSVINVTLAAGGNGTAQVTPKAAKSSDDRAAVAVDFRRGTEGQGIIAINLPTPVAGVDVRQEGDRIVADFPGLRIPRAEERRLDVTDFATPITSVDVFNYTGGSRLVIATGSPFEYMAYQSDELYTVEVKPLQPEPVTESQSGGRGRTSFSGEPLSLNFQDIEVRAVLQILADFTGLNVVVSDSVKGNITLRLKNVPWDQALDIILKTKGLSMRENGNVLLIAPTEEIAAREKLELEALQATEELEPLRSEIVQVNYAKADEIAELIKSGDTSIMSPRGSINVDPRTNTMIVQDISAKIAEVRDLVSELDRPVRQVMIDSRIVVADDDFSKEIGVRWGFAGSVGSRGNNAGTAGTQPGAEGSAQANRSGVDVADAGIGLAERLGVNLGTTRSPFGRIGLSILGTDYIVDLELSALQAEGRGEVLSNPRVVTTNRKQATIEQGVEIPYQEASSSGATSISFKKAVLALDVTPQITPNDKVIMDLVVKKDTVGENVPSGTVGGFIPSIDTREVETQVLVSDGETVVLGGIYERSQVQDVDKVPLLGDIPGLGQLFRRNFTQDDKAELLIFVTPKIVREALALQ